MFVICHMKIVSYENIQSLGGAFREMIPKIFNRLFLETTQSVSFLKGLFHLLFNVLAAGGGMFVIAYYFI